MSPRKPVLVTDTSKVVPMLKSSSATALLRNRGDPTVTRMSSQRPGLLIANTTAKSSLGLDDTVHSHDMSQKALKAIFEASKAGKPDSRFLEDCKGKPIQYLGASGGIVTTKYKSKVPKGNRPGITDQDVVTKKYENFAVFSDFPKGAGGVEPNELWQDGTYEKMLGQVTKEHDMIPKEINFQPAINPRQERFELAGQVGSQVFGDALHRQEIMRYFNAENQEMVRRAVSSLGITKPEDINRIAEIRQDLQDRQRTSASLGMPFDLAGEWSRALAEIQREREREILAEPRGEVQGSNAGAMAGMVPEALSGLNRFNRLAGINPASAMRNPGGGVTGSGAGDGRLDIYSRGGALDLIDLSRRPVDAPYPPYRPVEHPYVPGFRDTMSPRYIPPPRRSGRPRTLPRRYR